MKIKTLLHILLNSLMFTIYSVGMYFASILIIFKNVMDYDISDKYIFGLSLLGVLINPISMYVLKNQFQLTLNKDVQQNNEHRSFYYAAILFPFIMFIVSLVFGFIL